jgi:hypothetical protein
MPEHRRLYRRDGIYIRDIDRGWNMDIAPFQ